MLSCGSDFRTGDESGESKGCGASHITGTDNGYSHGLDINNNDYAKNNYIRLIFQNLMKVSFKIFALPLLLLCLSVSLTAREKEWPSSLSAGLQLGSGGLGIELAAPIGTSFRVRAGYSILPSLPYRRTVGVPEHPGAVGTEKGRNIPVDAKASLHLSDLEAFLDYYPLPDNGFHLTAGLLYGSRNVVNIRNITPLPDDYNIVGLDVDGYSVKAVANNIKGYIAVNPIRPYFGLGYDLPVGSDGRYSASFSVGAFYWGGPALFAPGEPLIGDWKDVRVPSSYLNGHDDGLVRKAEKTFVYPLVAVHLYRVLF